MHLMQGILIIAPNWIGDAVMTQPLLTALKNQHPNSTIDVLASNWVAPIYRACPEVNDVIEAGFQHQQLQWDLRKKLAKELRLKKYQACFVLPNSFKSAIIPWLANIPFRIGYRGELRYGLINVALDNPSKVKRPPMVEHYLALSQLLTDGNAIKASSLEPKLQVSSDAKQSTKKKLLDANLDPNSVFVFCPGAEYGPSKRWPTTHFAALANHVAQEHPNASMILLGSKSDHPLAEEILQQCQGSTKIHNWCGNTSLDEAIALIGLAKAVVSNDSGLMHIAAALKTPQVAIFGSSDPAHTPPLSENARVMWLKLPCSPCHKKECPLGHLKCLKDILPQQVLATLNTLL
jgi:heptosyltransferase-2